MLHSSMDIKAQGLSIQWHGAVAEVEWSTQPSFSSRALPDDTTVTLILWLHWPSVLFLAQCSLLAIHFFLFSSSCSHIIKCTVTRFPEAFRCIQPGRLWVAIFLCPVVKGRHLAPRLPLESKQMLSTISDSGGSWRSFHSFIQQNPFRVPAMSQALCLALVDTNINKA